MIPKEKTTCIWILRNELEEKFYAQVFVVVLFIPCPPAPPEKKKKAFIFLGNKKLLCT